MHYFYVEHETIQPDQPVNRYPRYDLYFAPVKKFHPSSLPKVYPEPSVQKLRLAQAAVRPRIERCEYPLIVHSELSLEYPAIKSLSHYRHCLLLLRGNTTFGVSAFIGKDTIGNTGSTSTGFSVKENKASTPIHKGSNAILRTPAKRSLY